jgi:hypothetical protein
MDTATARQLHYQIMAIGNLGQEIFNYGDSIKDRNCTEIYHYNINDKMRPWQDEPESKTVGNMLDNKKLVLDIKRNNFILK